MLLQQQPVLEANLTKNQQTIELLSKIMQIKKLKEAATQLTLCEAFFTVACPTSHGALTPHMMFSHSEKYFTEQKENRHSKLL